MITGEMYAELDHDVRGPLTVILGEVELVLSDGDVPAGERRRSCESVVGAVRQVEQMLVEWRSAAAELTPVRP